MMLLATPTSDARVSVTSIEFVGMPAGWWAIFGVLLLAGLAYGVFWLYRCEARVGASFGLRMFLATLRTLVLLGMAAIWVEPVVATYIVNTVYARTIVLTDTSASMSITDLAGPATQSAAGDPSGGAGLVDGDATTAAATGADDSSAGASRIGRVNRLYGNDDSAWLRRLADRNELRLYTFGRETQDSPAPWTTEAENASAATAAETPANGASAEASAKSSAQRAGAYAATADATDLGQALLHAQAVNSDAPIAGVIVVSDGIVNSGPSADDLAVIAERFRAPVHAVAVGAELEPPNLRIADFSAPATTARGDPFEVRIEVAAEGVDYATAELEIAARRLSAAGGDADQPRVIERRMIQIGGEVQSVGARLRLGAPEAGEFVYSARVVSDTPEAVTFDNQREVSVLILDQRLRVLLVAGWPSYEYRYVMRLLERDPTIDLICWLQSADREAIRDGNTIITSLPREPAELFEYDAVLLLDPNPAELDSAWVITLRRLVDEMAGGVLYEAGGQYATRLMRDERLAELLTILPVVPDPDAEVRLSEQGAYRTKAQPLRTPPETAGHPLLRVHPDLELNRRVWSAMPGVWWYLPVLRPKPLASALFEHGGAAHAGRYGPPVLMAVQPFGAGRTVFLGFDNTWRWRGVGEAYFNRFWIQVVRYLAQPRRQGASKRGAILLDRETFEVGDLVKVEARALDEKFAPLQAGELAGVLVLPDGATEPLQLRADPDRDGWFAGRVTIDQPGTLAIRVPLPGATPPAGEPNDQSALVKYIHVPRAQTEFRTLRMRTEALARIAEQTGGRLVRLDEAGDLPDDIENASRVRTTRGVDRPLWDNGWVMAAIAALLGVEWTLRRRNHLL